MMCKPCARIEVLRMYPVWTLPAARCPLPAARSPLPSAFDTVRHTLFNTRAVRSCFD